MGTVKHAFTSPVTDSGDPDLVGPDEWNDDHDITLTAADVGAATDTHDHDADYEASGAVATHTGDTSAAHAASAVSVDSTTLVGTGTDVQAVLEELDNGIADHLADTTAAHAASAISFSATGTIAGTDAQTAIAEVATDAASALSTHEADTTSVHGFANTDNVARIAGEITGTGASPTIAATHSGSAHHSAVTIGADAEHSLSGQVLSGVDASSSQKGHVTIGATAPPAIGTAAAGAATTEAAGKNHVHATGAGTPSTQAFGDAAATGSGPAAAMTDHKHAMPSLGTAPSTQASGDSAAGGSATDAAKTDHKHGFPVLWIPVNFAKSGTLSTSTGAFRWYNRSGRTLTFDSVSLAAGTAPTGAAILVDVNMDGTTIYTTQGNRPTIAISGNSSDNTTAPDVTTVADNHYITVDVDQVGSTIAGADLVVTVWMKG